MGSGSVKPASSWLARPCPLPVCQRSELSGKLPHGVAKPHSCSSPLQAGRHSTAQQSLAIAGQRQVVWGRRISLLDTGDSAVKRGVRTVVAGSWRQVLMQGALQQRLLQSGKAGANTTCLPASTRSWQPKNQQGLAQAWCVVPSSPQVLTLLGGNGPGCILHQRGTSPRAARATAY